MIIVRGYLSFDREIRGPDGTTETFTENLGVGTVLGLLELVTRAKSRLTFKATAAIRCVS